MVAGRSSTSCCSGDGSSGDVAILSHLSPSPPAVVSLAPFLGLAMFLETDLGVAAWGTYVTAPTGAQPPFQRAPHSALSLQMAQVCSFFLTTLLLKGWRHHHGSLS